MRYIIMPLIALLCLPAFGQSSDSINRKLEIERFTERIYSAKDLQLIVDSLQLSIDELCDYPVIFPIKKVQRISSGFGWRRHPITKARQFHTGIDIPQIKGTLVYATGNGVVSRKGYNSGYGNFVEIEHAGDFSTFYAHLSKITVNVGDWVDIAEQIGCVGNTGISTGNHLHYEVRKDSRYLNPIEWCYCLYEMFDKNNKKD